MAFVLLIGVQHLYNWLVRFLIKRDQEEFIVPLTIAASTLCSLAIAVILNYN